jgi:hypothetical protein
MEATLEQDRLQETGLVRLISPSFHSWLTS